jgi:hypothetical protein
MQEERRIRLAFSGIHQRGGGVDVYPTSEFRVAVDQWRDDGGQVDDHGG